MVTQTFPLPFHSPLVVVDRNVLIGRVERFLRPGDQILLTESALMEIATGDRLQDECKDFGAWLERFRDQVWPSLPWWHLVNRERSCNRRTTKVDVINKEIILEFRTTLSKLKGNWKNAFQQIILRRCEYDRDRKEFCNLATLFKQWVLEHRPQDWASLRESTCFDEDRRSLLTEPKQVASLAPLIANSFGFDNRYHSLTWQEELSVFPDRKVLGRLSRILLWYFTEFLVGRTSKFANNWDDMEYALLSSYSGTLATSDARLKSLMGVIFPTTELRNPVPS